MNSKDLIVFAILLFYFAFEQIFRTKMNFWHTERPVQKIDDITGEEIVKKT